MNQIPNIRLLLQPSAKFGCKRNFVNACIGWLVSLVMAACSSLAYSQTGRVETVATEATFLPLGDGSIDSFDVAYLNNRGETAFHASITGNSFFGDDGIYVAPSPSSSLRWIVREGTAADGGGQL